MTHFRLPTARNVFFTTVVKAVLCSVTAGRIRRTLYFPYVLTEFDVDVVWLNLSFFRQKFLSPSTAHPPSIISAHTNHGMTPYLQFSRGVVFFSNPGSLFLPGISSSGTKSVHGSSLFGIELESPGCSNALVTESPCEDALSLCSSCQVMISLAAFALSTRFLIIRWLRC